MEKDFEVKVGKKNEFMEELEVIEDERDLINKIQEGRQEVLENEIALADFGSVSSTLEDLSNESAAFVFNYIDREMVNPYNEKKTKGDFLNSYIMTKENAKEITEMIYEYKQYEDKNGNVKFRNVIKDRVKYSLYKRDAIKYWNDNNLILYLDDFKLLLNGGQKQEELLKESIVSDALYSDSERLKIASRKDAIDILGLKQKKNHSNLNVFVKHGGKEFLDNLENSMGDDFIDAELSDDDE